MSKYKVSECASDRHWHLFAVDDNEGNSVAHFTVATYGLTEARRRAEAECKWLNEKMQPWVVSEELKGQDDHRFAVYNRQRECTAGRFYVVELGLDLARTEAARLCAMLNERDAKGVQS